MHCFACKNHVFPKHYKPVNKEPEVVSPLLPSDFTRDVPSVAWKWLLQYGLPMSYWKPFVGWSEKDSRLVFTVGDPTVFSIGRYVGDDPQKQKRKWFVWGDSHKTGISFGDTGTKTVFVEDVVSAHKVGRVATAVPTFGTTIHPCHLRLARYLRKPIVLWQDKDQQGLTYKRANAISLATGLPCEVVHTDLDPKELDLQVVKEILKIE